MDLEQQQQQAEESKQICDDGREREREKMRHPLSTEPERRMGKQSSTTCVCTHRHTLGKRREEEVPPLSPSGPPTCLPSVLHTLLAYSIGKGALPVVRSTQLGTYRQVHTGFFLISFLGISTGGGTWSTCDQQRAHYRETLESRILRIIFAMKNGSITSVSSTLTSSIPSFPWKLNARRMKVERR